ncbi:MAG: pseudaminic acid cytidylyltransferase [Gammaproteobacteria bacterium]|nr:MAG: pseudaminic acid cytidylyltransferase [Gammaproteobacteria bacterium]
MRLAVIPARGGSKRIPRKNIRQFHGKPMIGWSIEAAQKANCFDQIIVSTDDDEIAEISRDFGAEVPFIRPKELADDHTGTIPVVAQAIDWYKDQGLNPKYICCIYATAPFIRETDILSGLEKIKAPGIDYAFSVTNYDFPIQRAITITQSGSIEMIDSAFMNTRSQDLKETYHDAGQFYWGCAEAWTNDIPIFSSTAVPIVLPRHRVQDIDTEEDWMRAEVMFDAILRFE